MNPLLDTTMSAPSCVQSDVEPAKVSRQERIANIERLRFLAACGVASLHTHTVFPRSFGSAGLLVLLLVLCVFVVRKPKPCELASLARRKGNRLLKPWLFWSVVYGGLGLTKVIYEDLSFSDVFSPTMLLTGTRIHLWFLPFGFVAAMLLGLVHQRIVKVPDVLTVVIAAFAGALCVFGFPIVQSRMSLGVPFEQWTFGLPAIPLGLAIGRAAALPDRRDRRNFYLLIGFLVAAACAAYIVFAGLRYGIWFDRGSSHAIRYIIAAAAVCSALHWQGKLDPISKTLASSSYGVYLIHPLMVVFLSRVGGLEQRPVILLCLVLVASILTTLALQRTRLKQFV